MTTVYVYVTNYTDNVLAYDEARTDIEEGDLSQGPLPNIDANATSAVLAFTAYHKHSKKVKGAVAYGGLDNHGLMRIKYGTLEEYPDFNCTTFVELICSDEPGGEYGYEGAVVIDTSPATNDTDADFKVYIDVYPSNPTSYPTVQGATTGGDTSVVINNTTSEWLTLQSSDHETYKNDLATTSATTCIPPGESLCINNYSQYNQSEPTLVYNLTASYALHLVLQGTYAPQVSWVGGESGDYSAGAPVKNGSVYTITVSYTGP